MGNMTVRNLPDQVHNHLKERAALNQRSLEAEVRSILTAAVDADSSGGFGQRLRARFKGVEGDELTIERDQTPSEPETFA